MCVVFCTTCTQCLQKPRSWWVPLIYSHSRWSTVIYVLHLGPLQGQWVLSAAEPSPVPFLLLFKIIFSIWEFWLHVCWRSEKGVGSIGTGVIDNCEPPRRCWECEGLSFIGLFEAGRLTLNVGSTSLGTSQIKDMKEENCFLPACPHSCWQVSLSCCCEFLHHH